MGTAPGPAGGRSALLPLLREIGDLKRIRAAGRPGSIAERAFRSGWDALAAGMSPEDVALATTAGCLAATRLADLDRTALLALGLSADEALAVGRAALADRAALLPGRLLDALKQALWTIDDASPAPFGFVGALADQPRAGITCPDRPRIVLLPAENHAEHCGIVAVYAVLLAEPDCDLGRVFLAAMAHHLHNAAMPDAGFTGEMLLGPHLEPVIERATAGTLAEIPSPLRERVTEARQVLPDTATPEGRAFHTADVLDRVLEIEQHLTAASLTMGTVLGEMALVHDGPVKPFHDAVLAEMGLPA